MSATARAVVELLTRAGHTVAVAESLTGGAVVAALVDVPGASRCVRGGVVAYAADLKVSLLDVDPGLLAQHGAVHADVARQMARGVRERRGATWGVATTGVAGPGPQDGHAAGTFHVAVDGPGGCVVRSTRAGPDDRPGDRAAVRRAATHAALTLLVRRAGDGEVTIR